MRWIVVGDILRKQLISECEAATAHQGWLRERHPRLPEFDRTRRAGNDCVNEWRVRLNISQRDCGTSRHSLRRRLIGCQSCNRSKDPRQCTSGRMTRARHIASLKVMGEGGQGNPLMPMLFSLGMHPREGGSGASQTFRANLRFLGRRVRGVFPGEGADNGKHSCRGVVESRSHPSARWENPNPFASTKSLHHKSTNSGPQRSGVGRRCRLGSLSSQPQGLATSS